jgi:hypothetical protein
VFGAPAVEPTAPAKPSAPVETRIGAFVTSLADVNESQRRFEIGFWVWLLSPASIGEVDPAATMEITNAASFDRQHTVSTVHGDVVYSQVKFRATIRNDLDFSRFPFDRHVLEVHLEDAERDARALELVVDTPPNGRAAVVLSSDLAPADWEIGAATLHTLAHVEPTNYGDPSQLTDSEFSRAVIGIEIARKHSLRILLTLLLGTFMAMIVAFFAVLLPIQLAPPRYTLMSGALFVCIANRLLVDARLPAGSSLGLLDQLQLSAIVGLIALIGASLWLTNRAEKLPPARGTSISQRMGVAWLGGLVLLQTVLVIAAQ